MMNEEPNYFQETKTKFKQYFDQRVLLLRLQATQKVTQIAASIVTIAVIIIVAIFLLIFASIAAGYWLADITGSLTMGFGIVALFYLLVFLFVVLFLRKIMQNFFTDKFINLLHKKN